MPEIIKEEVMIAILTYRREEALRACVESIAKVEIPDSIEMQVIVGDNDPESPGRPTLSGNVECVHLGFGQVAPARQRLLDLARSRGVDYLVYIDDDEIVSPRWLRSMIMTVRDFRCEAVTGPVLPTSLPSKYAPLHERTRKQTGSLVQGAGAGNLLLDVRKIGDITFDIAWDLPGGEDTDFTTRLIANGGEIRWCDEALVYEPVDPARLSRRWLIRRYYYNGRALARAKNHSAGMPRIAEIAARVVGGFGISVLLPMSVLNPCCLRLVLDHGVRNVGWTHEWFRGFVRRRSAAPLASARG